MDCFHRYYDFCNADRLGTNGPTRFEAWLDYKQAIVRREQKRCCICGEVRPISNLDVRVRDGAAGQDALAPENLICVCTFCEQTALGILQTRRQPRLA